MDETSGALVERISKLGKSPVVKTVWYWGDQRLSSRGGCAPSLPKGANKSREQLRLMVDQRSSKRAFSLRVFCGIVHKMIATPIQHVQISHVRHPLVLAGLPGLIPAMSSFCPRCGIYRYLTVRLLE
jgi:hypothetical protein